MDRETVCNDAAKLLKQVRHYTGWTHANILISENGEVQLFAFNSDNEMVHLLTNGKPALNSNH